MKRGKMVFLCLAALMLLLGLLNSDGSRQLRTELVFRLQQQRFEEAAESMLDFSSYKNIPGVGHINVWPCQSRSGERIVQFSMGGWGLGSGTGYVGVYTTTDGEPADFEGADVKLSPKGDGFFWQEKHGDNTYYTEEIVPGWFYYRATF